MMWSGLLLASFSRLYHTTLSSLTREPVTSISLLPYDLLLNCLARVPRLYHPHLSLVCKKFQSIVASPDFYKTRSLLNRTENCLYLCLHYGGNDTCWYILCKNVDQTGTSNSSGGGNICVRIPSPNYPCAKQFSLVAVGSNIYQFGGDGFKPSRVQDYRSYNWLEAHVYRRSSKGGYNMEAHVYESCSSRVSVLDCRSNKWHQAPNMRVDRGSSTASLVDGKIYVAGGYDNDSSLDWVEVFDPKTQTWDSVTKPTFESRYQKRDVKSLGLDGKFHLFWNEDVVYNPNEGIWNPIGEDTGMGYAVDTEKYCVIDNVLFFYDERVFKWYDIKKNVWKELKGLEEFPDLGGRYRIVKMSDSGGKMVVLWFEFSCNLQLFSIWCAEVALERRTEDEIWGKVEWSNVVLTVSAQRGSPLVDFLSVTV